MSNAKKLRGARQAASEAGEVLEKLYVSFGHTYSKTLASEVRKAIAQCRQQAATLANEPKAPTDKDQPSEP